MGQCADATPNRLRSRQMPRLLPQTRLLMDHYTSLGIFGNDQDGPEELRGALESRFADVRLETTGAAALFSARAPR